MFDRRLGAGLFAALLLLPAAAFAQQPTQAQKDTIRQLCRSDYQTHCSTVPAGGSASLSCLQQNAASLSAPCQQAIAAINPMPAPMSRPPAPSPVQPAQAMGQKPSRQQMAMLTRSCRGDFRVFCSDIQPGGGRGIACLIAHGPQLSSPCQSALSHLRHAR